MEQRAPGLLKIWANPFTDLRVPRFNLRRDPYERADITSNTYYDWMLSRAYILVPAQAYVGKFLKTFEAYPPRQRPTSFNVSGQMEALEKALIKIQSDNVVAHQSAGRAPVLAWHFPRQTGQKENDHKFSARSLRP